MKLSIVTTLYQSSMYVNDFYARIKVLAQQLTDDYEIIFVDDGSPDDSLDKAITISKSDSSVAVIELSRNFGHHRAMMVGMENATGEFVFLIDCDLEEPPELLTEFWEGINSDKSLDMVYGLQEEKTGSFFKKQASSSFYKIFNFFSFVKIPENELVSRLMTRQYVEALLSYKERELFIPGVWADVGFNTKGINSKKTFDGNSSYSFRKRISMATDAITSFSTKPLTYIFYLGLTISLISGLIVIYLVLNKLMFNGTLSGWTSMIASLYLIGGIIIFSIGVIGIYLSRIFSEVKGRPNSLIRCIHTKNKIN